MKPFHEYIFTEDLLPLPSRLYHYTSQEGLIGIVASKTFWSTSIHYLNDSTEFNYTLNLIRENLRLRGSEKAKESTLNWKAVFEVMERHVSMVNENRFHVCCFSQLGDVLSQWRGYCPKSGGFSLGFTGDQLSEAASRQHCFIAPCIYDVSRQNEFVKLLLDRFAAEIATIAGAKSSTIPLVTEFFTDCAFLASILKHPSFAEEREWRIVSQSLGGSHPGMAIRPGKFVPIPYYKFELCRPEETLDVEVIVGPTPEPQLAKDAVTMLLKIHNCSGSARNSVVPYREL